MECSRTLPLKFVLALTILCHKEAHKHKNYSSCLMCLFIANLYWVGLVTTLNSPVGLRNGSEDYVTLIHILDLIS